MNLFLNLNLVGIVFLSGIFSAIFYFTLYDNGDHLQQQIEDVKNQIIKIDSRMRQQEENLKEAVIFNDSVKRLGRDIEMFLQYLPEKLTTLNLFSDITKVSQDSLIDIKTMTNSQDVKENTGMYSSIAVRLSVEGNFAQLLTFLSKLTDLDKFITVKNVRIRPVGNRKKDEANIQKIAAEMTLIGYRYSKSSSEGNVSVEKKKI